MYRYVQLYVHIRTSRLYREQTCAGWGIAGDTSYISYVNVCAGTLTTPVCRRVPVHQPGAASSSVGYKVTLESEAQLLVCAPRAAGRATHARHTAHPTPTRQLAPRPLAHDYHRILVRREVSDKP